MTSAQPLRRGRVDLMRLPAGLSDLARTLYGFLTDHVGRELAEPRAKFLLACRREFDPAYISDAKMRMAKEELVEVLIPMEGGDAGWSLAKNFEEGERAAKYLEQRGKDLLHKAARIREGVRLVYGCEECVEREGHGRGDGSWLCDPCAAAREEDRPRVPLARNQMDLRL